MFKIESYVTPILLSYVDKYVRDFKPADAQVSLWGGGVALHNLVLKADVLQQEVALPFTLVSGRIHELLIQVPWTKIMSEPIVVTIDTIECILSPNPTPTASEENVQPEFPSKAPLVEAPPGYMQALVRRIVSNISLRVHHLIVKYVQDDVVLSLNVKHLSVDSAGPDWEPAFADIDQSEPLIRRLMRLDDLTLCLDRADSDGKIRYYQEPLLYRCQLDLRVWTRLVSASTRRASNLGVQLRSSRLAWGATNEQLTLLIRLLRERAHALARPPPPPPKPSAAALVAPPQASSANTAEPVRTGSWSEWAWSWLPAWADREAGVEEAAPSATPIPVYFSAYLDQVTLVFKMMETDGSSRRRARGVLELRARHAAVRAAACAPTALRVRAGVRALRLLSHGKCVCGYQDVSSANEEATVYLSKKNDEGDGETWTWPPEIFEDKIETAEVAEEQQHPLSESILHGERRLSNVTEQQPAAAAELPVPADTRGDASAAELPAPADDELWRTMAPVIYCEYTHARSPPNTLIDPYDNPPKDFEFSDWEEDSNMKINIQPLDVRFSIGLIHRLSVLRTIFQDLPPDPGPDIPKKTLTVEECDALYENIPQRRISIDIYGFRLRMVPWDHSMAEKQATTPLFLDVDIPHVKLIVSGPLYSYRVCSAASQLPKDEGPLWRGARLHVSAELAPAAALGARAAPPRPVARARLRLVAHLLLHPHLFQHRDSVTHNYTLKIHEVNACGSAARLQAAWQVAASLLLRRQSAPLRHTTLARDAMADGEAVAIDATLEDVTMRGFVTRHVNTHSCIIQTARTMALYSPNDGTVKQAWLFSAPDSSTPTPFLRIAGQLGEEEYKESLDYFGLWTAPIAMSLDPLLITWLAYRPQLKPTSESFTAGAKLSSQFHLRRRVTSPSSSGRGASRTGSGSEPVHAARPRSLGSSSERRRSAALPPAKESDSGLPAERVLKLHARLQRVLLNVELGQAVAYVSAASASALDCATLTDAMERHAAAHNVLALSMGLVTISSNSATKYLWNDVRNDGPTYRPPVIDTAKHVATESFPWKLCLADVTCYTMEAREQPDAAREPAGGLSSRLRGARSASARVLLEPVSTAVTLSVVTKTMQIRTWVKPQEQPKVGVPTADEIRLKYFTTGPDFKPTTLKEFVRGPAKRKKTTADPSPPDPKPREPTEVTTQGPVMSIGIHLHADTPPVKVKLDQNQVHIVAAAVHCLRHLHILMNRSAVSAGRHSVFSGSLRSVSELEEQQSRSDENISESQSDLVPILEYHAVPEVKLKKFLWFQWVMGGATLVVGSHMVKLAFNADDIISTVDLQEHYNQLKIKIASASVKYNKKNSNDEWATGVLGGRVLEAREPVNGKEENHFLAVTVTQAQISDLPDSWKEELHPKLLLQKSNNDSMWEIYATLAPLEAVIQPAVLENILTLTREMAPPPFCPLDTEIQQRSSTWQWPFLYVSAGGLRLLIATDRNDHDDDDTLLFIVGKVAVNPYPENPICRRAVNSAMESGWTASGALEGRQYELFVRSVAVQSARFSQIAHQEAIQMQNQNAGSENPAVKWTQPNMSPIYSSILHPVEINCVLAPALYLSKSLACGPAVELNLASDCDLEISLGQLKLIHQVVADAKRALLFSFESCTSLDDSMCPYALIIKEDMEFDGYENAALKEEDPTSSNVGYCDRSFGADSGVDMSTSKSSRLILDPPNTAKKTVSVAFAEEKSEEASEYLEFFITMGTVDFSLVVRDDDTAEVVALRTPWTPVGVSEVKDTEVSNSGENAADLNTVEAKESITSRSLTETVRNADIGQTKLELDKFMRTGDGLVPLVHVTLHQPNLYYWKKKTQSSMQVSLFNAWIGLGSRQIPGFWNEPILSTAKGVPDPVSDIPPALATIKIVIPLNGTNYLASNHANPKGTVNVDIERPVLLQVSAERLRRISLIVAMIKSKMDMETETDLNTSDSNRDEIVDLPPLFRLRKYMVDRSFGSITIQCSQVGVSGSDGTVGWDSASLQIAAGLRPDRLIARGLVTALLAAAGAPGDCRHVVMQPLMLGVELESRWEAWRRIEGGISAREPSVHMTVDLDRVTFDVRPSDLATLSKMQRILENIYGSEIKQPAPVSSIDSIFASETLQKPQGETMGRRGSGSSVGSNELEDHYYKDDLKSGAFKIVTSSQLPMAYQVTLHGTTVSWRYPHPRTITRIILFPIPGIDEEVNCVLELYSFLLKQWMPHTSLILPVLEPREFKLYVAPPDAVFGMMWRVRAYADIDNEETPFEFKVEHYMPRTDPLQMSELGQETPFVQGGATAQQLSSALRVDSYFAPRLLPRMRLSLRLTELELHAHNSLPYLTSQATALEGYYVSRPLMRSHRVLSVVASDFAAHAHLGTNAGRLLFLDTKLSCDVMECATGTLQETIGKTRLRAALSAPCAQGPRVRAFCDPVRVAMHVPRLRTLCALRDDWSAALEQYKEESGSSVGSEDDRAKLQSKAAVAEATAAALEGRVSLWLHNSCASTLRVGQEDTDEIVPLGPGARLAYRWRFPSSPLKLRFALTGPSTDWHWSASMPFTPGVRRIRLEDAESLGGAQTPGGGVFLHARVTATGARRSLELAGRLVLANALRRPLLYKVRARCADAKTWRSVSSGELDAESVGRSVLCGADCEMVLKIKFTFKDTGWSGDIPLKECPKENVPWLVKVPSEGETAYVSVWCRVVRARSDGRVLAAVWPLYVLQSHLPLDTDVLVSTETELSTAELAPPESRPAPLVQTSPGRGACAHLLAPGTTAARHQLSFQYKDIECPVTREAIPLHYGVTDTSVFDKRAPVNNIEDVVEEIRAWFDRSGHGANSKWPYSIVTSHWFGDWHPAKLQPRCDVTVRYGAVRAGGGCSLEVQLCPVVLLCNAAPLALTLRAHDAAPLCKVEPGAAIAAPSAVLQKPFFMSVEVGRETFVSSQLRVWAQEPGRYGAPPGGCVALDHAAPFAVQCNQKVALLTLYYEIKEEINVLGVSPTFVVINRLNKDVLVSAIAVPNEGATEPVLQPKSYKIVAPTKEGSLEGEPLPRFYLFGRWRGGDPAELRALLCLALPARAAAPRAPAPVRLARPPFRRALHLVDDLGNSMAVVVVQQKHEGRWLVTVAPDPCPQFVVHNRTSQTLAIAECARAADDAHATPPTQTVPECEGARWWCEVPAGAMAHYSTPSHSARFPPAPAASPPDPIPYITIGSVREAEEPEWGAGVAAAGGEQLLQLPSARTVKLRARPHPHSALLELQDVDQDDISASDIRRRLQTLSEDFISFHQRDPASSTKEKSGITDTLLTSSNDENALITTPSATNLPAKVQIEILPGNEKTIDQLPDTSKQIDIAIPVKPEQTDELPKNPEQIENLSDLNYKLHETDVLELGTNSSKMSLAENPQQNQDHVDDSHVSNDKQSTATLSDAHDSRGKPSFTFVADSEWDNNGLWSSTERLRCVISGIAIEIAEAPDIEPLLALHVDRAAVLVQSDHRGTRAVVSIADVQVDNLQYESGQFDFGVVASTRAAPLARDACPPLWGALAARGVLDARQDDARLLLRLRRDRWRVGADTFDELTEVEASLGPLALYVEDSYVAALAALGRAARAPAAAPPALVLADARALQRPLRLRALHLHPLDLTLTLHTAVRMYIALDQSPLRLSAFQLQDMMTSAEHLTHALTVHYLSAAILGAGWVVGGLELLGAPGALAARVGGATGGVRGVAAAAAAALLRSLSACAGSLARNLDLLAGDEEHARRAAAARRRPPASLVAGLAAGITNFAINLLGAVGGLAHHPLVAVAVGEAEGGATALRRGLLGALAKPLSATADLVAFAGTGLLRQTGWDPVPQPRAVAGALEAARAGWRRDCVRWAFRLAELRALAGFDVLLDGAPLRLLLTHKFLVITDPETERIMEMIDLRYCTLGPYKGSIVELMVTQKRQKEKASESRVVDEEDEYQVSEAAMARVARYTGARGAASGAARVLALLPAPRRAPALHAALAAAVHHNADSHHDLL